MDVEQSLRSEWEWFRHLFSLSQLKGALVSASDDVLIKARGDVEFIFTGFGRWLAGNYHSR